MTTYTINTTDTETPTASTNVWQRLCASLVMGAQDSGRCRFTATTDRPAELEAALNVCDEVLDYEEVI